MAKIFNVTGACDPQLHYMVDIRKRLEEIRALVDAGAYFTINRARQYGKTTTLNALSDFLKNDYIVISLDFQLLSSNDFENETAFANAFAAIFVSAVRTGAAAKAGAVVKTGAGNRCFRCPGGCGGCGKYQRAPQTFCLPVPDLCGRVKAARSDDR